MRKKNPKFNIYYPRSLQLQWHITEHCNLRCAHCYQETYHRKDLSYQNLLTILNQYLELLDVWRGISWRPVWGHISITGGDPFMRDDFFDLLEICAENKKKFTFSILTNGSAIDIEIARRLKKLNPTHVQVSIEGCEKTHDTIRGQGNYIRTVSAIRHLVSVGIDTSISFTAHRDNYREFPEVARLGRRLKVSHVWADRLIPDGSAIAMRNKIMSPSEVQKFFWIMKNTRDEDGVFRRIKKTKIHMSRALQFLVGGGRPYHCVAGDHLITVMPNGDLFPCRRLPIRVGNLMEASLPELYYTSEHFLLLRDKNNIPDKCQNCRYRKKCRGGLKCLSYAITGDLFQYDPSCWLVNHSAV